MKAGMFVFVTGLILTFGAAGGVENSITDAELISSVIVAAVGLAVMYAGTLILNRQNR